MKIAFPCFQGKQFRLMDFLRYLKSLEKKVCIIKG